MKTDTAPATNMKQVVILGATSGMALEIQRQLARRGCELFLVARSAQRLAELQADLTLRGARKVLTYSANLAAVQQHAAVFDFAQRSFPKFDTVLLAYGSMHEQKDSESSIDVLLEELQVNFVSATAILTLFAADLERRHTDAWLPSPPLPEIADAVRTTSTVRPRALCLFSCKGSAAAFIPPASASLRLSLAGADSDDRPHGQFRALCRSRARRPRYRTSTRTPFSRRPLHAESLALRHDCCGTYPGNNLQALVV